MNYAEFKDEMNARINAMLNGFADSGAACADLEEAYPEFAAQYEEEYTSSPK